MLLVFIISPLFKDIKVHIYVDGLNESEGNV